MQEIARDAVRLGRSKGAQEVAAVAYRDREVQVDWRDAKLEKISEATTRGVSLQLYVDGRYAQVTTSDLRPDALERFVEDAVAMTRTLAKDPFRSLPEPGLYHGQSDADLALEDAGYDRVGASDRKRAAAAIEAAARTVPGHDAILSVTSGFSDSLSESFRVHSNGFEGDQRKTEYWMSCSVSVKDADDRRPEDWDQAGSRVFAELPSPEGIGRSAAERALARRGAQKTKSAPMTMVVDARVAGRLVGYLGGALTGGALQQKRSFLEGKLGSAIASPRLTLADDPLLPRGFGSRRFDGEGIAARRLPIIEAGVLRAYYIDTYYGKKLKMAPTTARYSNVTFAGGPKSQAELCADARDGILVTSFLGGNSNSTTGDYSVGVRGFIIRAGRLAEPVGEMNVSGNLLELWKRLVAVGNDPYAYSSVRAPTLMFEKVMFAGV
jgi:PmbA protein